MIPRLAVPALAAALLVAGCAGEWRPPPTDPLVGWRETPTETGDVREWMRGQAVLQELPPTPLSPAELERRFRDPGTAAGDLGETVSGEITNVELAPLRHFGDVSWVDVAFDLAGVRRKIRVSWFAAQDGTHRYHLLAPASDWNTRDLSDFQDIVRQRDRESRLEE